MSYSNFEQGSIVLADVRFADRDESKERPVVILSNDKYNQKSYDLILFKITSKRRKWLFDVSISKDDLSEGNLKKESVIKADFPIVLSKNRLKKKIAKVNQSIICEVIKKLNDAIKN